MMRMGPMLCASSLGERPDMNMCGEGVKRTGLIWVVFALKERRFGYTTLKVPLICLTMGDLSVAVLETPRRADSFFACGDGQIART